MRHSYSFCRIVVALYVVTAVAVACIAEAPKLVPLFTGRDMTHFKAEGAAEFWLIENEVLIGENNPAKKGHYLWKGPILAHYRPILSRTIDATTPRNLHGGVSTVVSVVWLRDRSLDSRPYSCPTVKPTICSFKNTLTIPF